MAGILLVGRIDSAKGKSAGRHDCPAERSQFAQVSEHGSRSGKAWRDHGLVFATSVGTPVEHRNINRRWDELRERAGLDGLRLHDLRHGCATFMLAAGVPARAIMEVLGHSEISVTMNTYTRVLAQPREDAADAIVNVLGT